MKKTVLLSVFIFLPHFVTFAQVLKPDFKLQKVTVYLVGAELNYQTKVPLSKGRSTILFSSLSQTIIDNSVRVNVDNNVKIISVSVENAKVNFEKEIKSKQDSLEVATNKVLRLDMEKKSYALEKRILVDNITRIGASESVGAAELMNATKLYREKLNELDNIEFKLNKEEQSWRSVIMKLEDEKSKLLANQSVSVSGSKVKQLVIEVESKADVSGVFDMSYLVADAGWSPKYNVRAFTDAAEMEFEYRANVYNNSGINWKNVKVALSTASTETKLIKPELGYAWTLDFNSYNQPENAKATGEGKLSDKQLKNDKVELVEIEAPELDLYMNLDVLYDIAADNEPHMVSVGDFKLPVRYKYYAVPKVDDNVYLIAYVHGWQKLNLIEGENSIYYNGAFLGNSYLYTKYSNTELEVSLGTEKGIQISKVKKEDKEAEKTIGTNRFVHLTYDIDVRNNKTKDVEVEITDQVPVSSDSDIILEILQTSGATMDEQNGKLTWNLNLKPAEFKKLTVEFSVKYPRSKSKQMNITLFRFGRQKVICPKFR